MKNITKRRIGIFAGLAILFGSLAGARFLSQQKEPPERKANFEKAKEVDTMHVFSTTVPTSLGIQGELSAYDKIDIFSEVSGTLESTSRPFKVGTYFPKGSVLIRVDAEEARLSLLAQKSNLLNAITQLMPDLKIDYPESYGQWNKYLENFEPDEPLAPLPEPLNEQEKYFIASRNLYSQYYNIKSAEERLNKYILYAPFSGVITAATINPGAVVRAGQKLGELMNTSNYELEATVALRDLKYIKPGSPATLHSDDIAGTWQGQINRISDQVDAGTQTVRVFIGVRGQRLRENMYLKGEVEASSIEDAIKLPRELVVGQQAVFVLRDSFLNLQQVQVLKMTDDAAIIKGLEDGTPILKEMIPDAFDGMKVIVRKKKESEEAMAPKKEEKVMGSLK